MHKYLSRTTKRQQYVDPIINPTGGEKVFGDYPIMEWVDPKFAINYKRDSNFA